MRYNKRKIPLKHAENRKALIARNKRTIANRGQNKFSKKVRVRVNLKSILKYKCLMDSM
jgi:hypothetical protein